MPEFENSLTFAAKTSVKKNIQNISQTLTPITTNQQPGPVNRTLSAPSPVTNYLRERKEKIDYKGQQIKHNIQQGAQEAKGKCKTMWKSVRKSVKAVVTKLAPGAFSPKQQTPASAPSSPRTTSASSWNFWPSK